MGTAEEQRADSLGEPRARERKLRCSCSPAASCSASGRRARGRRDRRGRCALRVPRLVPLALVDDGGAWRRLGAGVATAVVALWRRLWRAIAVVALWRRLWREEVRWRLLGRLGRQSLDDDALAASRLGGSILAGVFWRGIGESRRAPLGQPLRSATRALDLRVQTAHFVTSAAQFP